MNKSLLAAIAIVSVGVGFLPFHAQAATIAVNTTADEFDGGEPNANCSLREAIQSANNDTDFGGCAGSGGYGDDTITVPAGTYFIGSFGGCEDGFDNSQGDFDILSNVIINGAAANATFVDAAGCDGPCDRVFDVISEGSISVVLRALTIRNGAPPVCEDDGLEDGGGIRNGFVSDLTLDRVVVTGNRAANGGGLSNIGTFSIVGSTISNNQAEGSSEGEFFFGGDGGGIRSGLAPVQNENSPETLPIINSTISGNTAREFGGGIVSSGRSIALRNVTITDNQANLAGFGSAAGGGIALLPPPEVPGLTVRAVLPFQAEFIVRNTIVAENSDGGSEDLAPDCLALDFNAIMTSEGFNLIGDNTGCGSEFADGVNGDQVGSDTQPIDPLLGPLTNNGGTTPTHALLTNSTAIDLANSAGCFANDANSGTLLLTDQRGLTRPADGNDDNNIRCDIGAFEVQPLCGNAIVNPNEECDDGNLTNGDGCAADCTVEPFCGDHELNEGETCDDGNNGDGDGCSAECEDEVPGKECGNGIVETGEECDGPDSAEGGCEDDCTLSPFCGDGVTDEGEECDDGNNSDADKCSNTCLDTSGIAFLLGAGGCSLSQAVAGGNGFVPSLGLLAGALVTLLVKRRKIR